MPGGSLPADAALGVALRELIAGAESGRTEHACDVRFGRDIVAVLADAADQLADHEQSRKGSARKGSAPTAQGRSSTPYLSAVVTTWRGSRPVRTSSRLTVSST